MINPQSAYEIILVGQNVIGDEDRKNLSLLLGTDVFHSLSAIDKFSAETSFVCIVSSPICWFGQVIQDAQHLREVFSAWNAELQELIGFLRKNRRQVKVICLERILQNNAETMKHISISKSSKQSTYTPTVSTLFLQMASNWLRQDEVVSDLLDELDASLSGAPFLKATDIEILEMTFDEFKRFGGPHERDLDLLQDSIDQLVRNGENLNSQLGQVQSEKSLLESKIKDLEHSLQQKIGDVYYFQHTLQDMHKTLSWRITGPLRKIRSFLR